MTIDSRQQFLGTASEETIATTKVGVIGLCGGGSHIVQQLAHIGFLNYVLCDPQKIDKEGTNLNRFVGATAKDVECEELKVEITAREILSVRPHAKIEKYPTMFSDALDALRSCTIIFGCVDSYIARDELERFCRRNLIVYIDMGMDVTLLGDNYVVAGQVILSSPEGPCLRCLGFINDDLLKNEAMKYGETGPRPQVIWPNGVLASIAVGLCMQILLPWHQKPVPGAYLEYDGNNHTVSQSQRFKLRAGKAWLHYSADLVGDPFFDIRTLTKLHS